MKIEQEIMEMFDKLMKSDYDYYNFEQYEVDGLKDFISHIITLVQKREREEMVEKVIKYIRNGNVAGSFSDSCDCEKCNKFEKKVRKDLLT